MRGRKAGSVSFQLVSLDELNRLLKPEATVVVSNRFAKLLGLKGKSVSADLGMYNETIASNNAQHALETFGAAEQITAPLPTAPEEKTNNLSLKLTEFKK